MSLGNINIALTKFSFGLQVRVDLYKKIASFVANGVPIHEIVQKLRREYEKVKKNDVRAVVLADIEEEMDKGISFGQCLDKWVPAAESMVIIGGENSGNLEKSLVNAITITESAHRMKSTIKAEMSYPLILLMMLSGLIYMFSTQAIPELTTVLPVEKWPDMSRSLYDMSMFVKNDWWVVLSFVAAFIGFSIYTLPRTTGGLRKLLNKFPPWSIYKSFQSSVFLVATSAMMSTGKPIFDSIEMLKDMSDSYVKHELDKILKEIESGATPGDAINSGGFLDVDTGIDVAIYGQVANLDTALHTIGADSINNGIERIKAVAGAFKNLVLFGVAGYVAWVYYAFYTLTQSIGAQAGT